MTQLFAVSQYPKIKVFSSHFVDYHETRFFGKITKLSFFISVRFIGPRFVWKVILKLLIISSISETFQSLSAQIGIGDLCLEPFPMVWTFETFKRSIEKLKPGLF